MNIALGGEEATGEVIGNQARSVGWGHCGQDHAIKFQFPFGIVRKL